MLWIVLLQRHQIRTPILQNYTGFQTKFKYSFELFDIHLQKFSDYLDKFVSGRKYNLYDIKYIQISYYIKDHITKLCQSCYYQLRQIRTVRHSLTSSAIKTLVHAFICTRVDFSNSLLYGTSACLLDRLQSVLNSAARLILRIGKINIWSDLGCNSTWPSLASGSVSYSIQVQLHHEKLPGWPCTEVPDRAVPLREWHSSKAQPSVVVSGSAPGPSISEGTIRSTRLLRLLTTAVELTSCRHPTSTQRTSTLPEETQNSLHATVHVMPLRIDVNSVISTTTNVRELVQCTTQTV